MGAQPSRHLVGHDRCLLGSALPTRVRPVSIGAFLVRMAFYRSNSSSVGLGPVESPMQKALELAS